MVIPIVTELPLALEPTTRDDFLGSQSAPRPSPLAARLPDARLHVIEGGEHLFLLDELQSAVGRILGFLNERM